MAGGSKASVKLFREVLGFKSTAQASLPTPAATTGRRYSEFLTAIDEIEKATGLDFLSALPETVQDEIESRKAPRIW